jgi:hypothetical protein
MLLVMRGRNESIINHTTRWEIGKARSWLRRVNRARGDRAPATLFHLLLYACARTLHERPGLNCFVAGGRLYQRRGVWISFAAKTQLTDDAPLVTVKLEFPAGESFLDCVRRVNGAVEAVRAGREQPIDREARLLARLPTPLVRVALAAARRLDALNLLPAAFIEPDPLYTSAFLANLGSIRIDRTTHHLYEHGTCTLFGVMGAPRKDVVVDRAGHPVVREILEVHWTFDERVSDGFYGARALAFARRLMEDPETRIGPPGSAVDGHLPARADVPCGSTIEPEI